MKLKIPLMIIMASIVFVVGCTGGSDDVVGGAFVGGTGGLTIGFANDAPPDRVFDFDQDDNEGEDFDIIIEIENVGEFDIPENKVIVSLSGIDV
ncbi:MAG: hypothetical protein IH819_04680, partial [Bacteroidetes bacterium]|nr:hypothetical protein [Bacteroidota bacterium]